MTVTSTEIKKNQSKLVNQSQLKLFFIMFGLEILLILLGLLQLDGGIWDGALSRMTFFKALLNPAHPHHTGYLNATITYSITGLATLFILFLALFQRDQGMVIKFKLFLAIAFGILLTYSINIATSNLIFMFFSLTFVPIAYYYYINHGEIQTLFSNKVMIFALRRSLAIIPMFLAISMLTFFGANLIGDPVQIALRGIREGRSERESFLLNKYGLIDENGQQIAVWQRYLDWVYSFIHGDWGESYRYGHDVTTNIGRYFWETIKLQIAALLLAFVLSVVLGMLAAYYHKTTFDSIVSSIALLGLSMPIFVIGIVAILTFGGTGLDWFPTAGAHSLPQILVVDGCSACAQKPGEILNEYQFQDINWWFTLFDVFWVYTKDSLLHMVLPLLTLTFASLATYTRLTRSTMLEILRQDYILAARANGLSESKIMKEQAMPNVLLPLITFVGINMGFLLGGSPILETVFSWPGLGVQFLDALNVLDLPILMALTMVITVMILLANMITDIAYTYLDPRISL